MRKLLIGLLSIIALNSYACTVTQVFVYSENIDSIVPSQNAFFPEGFVNPLPSQEIFTPISIQPYYEPYFLMYSVESTSTMPITSLVNYINNYGYDHQTVMSVSSQVIPNDQCPIYTGSN